MNMLAFTAFELICSLSFVYFVLVLVFSVITSHDQGFLLALHSEVTLGSTGGEITM